ncbi:MAG: hypothetical protein KF690_02290 [Bacteroidetes bacterium]|nr:hypothetical protein [Bacteroidota bacterium]
MIITARRLWLVILLPAIIAGHLSAQEIKAIADYPDLRAVCKEALYYELPGNATLSRSPQGWHIRYHETQKTEETSLLLWNRETRTMEHLPFPRQNKPPEPAEISRWVAKHRHAFYLATFWGYPEYYMDILNHVDSSDTATDAELEQLARAHSHATVYALGDQYGESNIRLGDLSFQMETDDGSYTSQAIAAFYKHTHQGLHYYKRIHSRNAGYRTRGLSTSITARLANEYVSAYLNAEMYLSHREQALQFLQQARYPEFYLQYARAMLRHLPPSSYLFTNGDFDTYPLLYVQEAEGFRKDVRILNASLLNLDTYVRYVHKGSGQGPALLNNNLDIAGSKLGSFTKGNETHTLQLPNLGITVEQKADFDGGYGGYWMLASQALIGLLQENDAQGWPHPVAIATTVTERFYKHLAPYLSEEGFVFRLTGKTEDPGTRVHTCLQLLEDMPLVTIETGTQDISAIELANNIYRIAYQAARQALALGEEDKALRILQLVKSKVHTPVLGSTHLQLALLYKHMEMAEEHNQHLQAFQNLANKASEMEARKVYELLHWGLVYHTQVKDTESARRLYKTLSPLLIAEGWEAEAEELAAYLH